MSFTVKIPQNYAARIISNLRDTGTSSRMQDAAVRNLNIQPDGSILVRSSAETPYGAAREIFKQNLGIPIAAIRGFQTFADTLQEARKHNVSVAPTPVKNAAVAPNALGDRGIAPEDIAGTGAGDIEDLSAQERVVPGQIVEGPTPFTESRRIIPSFYSEGNLTLPSNNEDLLRLDELESQMFDSLARGRSVPEDVIEELEELRGGQDYEESSLAAGIFDDPVVSEVVTDDTDDAENPEIPGNLPAYWQERYNEYLALSPELQKIILDRQIQNNIELDPYRSLGGTELNFLLGDPNATVNPDGSISFGPKFEPQVPDPSQLEGFAATDLQDILNIFYANPEQYISEVPLFEDIYDPDTGQLIGQRQAGTQQVLSPVAQAALQAFSTQRGAESADVASRFGTATPFGAIAGLGGTADQAISLAELQARAGVTNPFAALGTGSTIEDIGSILRGGLDVQQQLDLEGLRARGGLDVEQQLALAGLQARGGISPEQRLAEQRMALLPQLFQTSPQALGGLQRILGEQQLQQALTPFFSAGNFQPQAQVADSVPFAQGPSGTNVNINPDLVENVSGRSPFAGGPVTQTISGTTQPVSAVSPGFRPTVGQYQRAGLFDRGGLEAEAGMAGQELTPFLQDVTPLGASTRPGGLGAQRTTRFTY